MNLERRAGMDCSGGVPRIPTKYFNPSDAKIWFGLFRARVHYRGMSLIDRSSRSVASSSFSRIESLHPRGGGVREEA
jgi:hypothetical protein